VSPLYILSSGQESLLILVLDMSSWLPTCEDIVKSINGERSKLATESSVLLNPMLPVSGI